MKPLDVKLPRKFLPTISAMAGDIGTDKRKNVRYESNRNRKYYFDDLEGAHEARFELINSNFERLSKYKRAPNIDIKS